MMLRLGKSEEKGSPCRYMQELPDWFNKWNLGWHGLGKVKRKDHHIDIYRKYLIDLINEVWDGIATEKWSERRIMMIYARSNETWEDWRIFREVKTEDNHFNICEKDLIGIINEAWDGMAWEKWSESIITSIYARRT